MLLQWKGLPYAECTFETPEVIAEAGGQEALDEYEVSAPILQTQYALRSSCMFLPFIAIGSSADCCQSTA